MRGEPEARVVNSWIASWSTGSVLLMGDSMPWVGRQVYLPGQATLDKTRPRHPKLASYVSRRREGCCAKSHGSSKRPGRVGTKIFDAWSSCRT